VKKAEFVKELELSRSEWDSLFNKFQVADLDKQGVITDLSLKDLLAHISWYEDQMVNLLVDKVLAGSPLWELGQSERNLTIYELNKDRGIDEVLQESKAVYEKLIAEIKLLTDKDLSDPRAFEGMPEDWVPWMIIAGNSFEHYKQHLEDLGNWYKLLNK
jgi:hypothetical protein